MPCQDAIFRRVAGGVKEHVGVSPLYPYFPCGLQKWRSNMLVPGIPAARVVRMLVEAQHISTTEIDWHASVGDSLPIKKSRCSSMSSESKAWPFAVNCLCRRCHKIPLVGSK